MPFFKFISAASKKLILDQWAIKIWNRVLGNTLWDLFDFDLNITNQEYVLKAGGEVGWRRVRVSFVHSIFV